MGRPAVRLALDAGCVAAIVSLAASSAGESLLRCGILSGVLILAACRAFDLYRHRKDMSCGTDLVLLFAAHCAALSMSAALIFAFRIVDVPPTATLAFFAACFATMSLPRVVAYLMRPRSATATTAVPLKKGAYIAVKRAMDVVTAVAATAALSPLLFAIALAVRLTSRGPALFMQKRVGRGGREFFIIKFRSMFADAEQRLKRDPRLAAEFEKNLKIKNDPRITPLGRVLRKSSLDELPQLLNVLKGEMSLVGPRPVPLKELPLHGFRTPSYLAVRPGITGMWQVSGRNEISMRERVVYNAYYTRYLSLWLDVKILFKTLLVVAGGRGAY